MKIKLSHLKKLIKEEILASTKNKRVMAEGHSRITAEEVNAWMSGDWGFVSEASGEFDPYADIETWVNSPQRTVGQLRDAYDDLTKTVVGISLTPPEDIEILKSEIIQLQHIAEKG